MLTSKESFDKLNFLVTSRNLTFYRLGKELGIQTSFFSEWKRGKMMPKNEKLKTLADYFSVSIEYFLE